MNANRRRVRYRADRNADPGAGSATAADGRDYMVSYFLNEYQRGSMVMRFASPPGAADLVNELQKYGLSAAALKDVSATPVADVKDQGARYAQAQRATEAAQAQSESMHARARGPSTTSAQDRSRQRALNREAIRQGASEWPAENQGQEQWDAFRGSRTTPKKRGCFGPLIGVAVVLYGLTAAFAVDAYDDGSFAAIVDVPPDASFGEKAEACASSLENRAAETREIYGDHPGPFEDRISTFLPHPANASFIVGCLAN